MAKSAQDFFERRQSSIERERLAKIGKLKKAMKVFVAKYPAIESVYIVGSLVNKLFYRSESDVDVVVKGLSRAEVLKASSFLEKIISANLDLILWDDLDAGSKTLKEAVKIYEKK